MKATLYAAMVALVSAAPGDACGIGSGQEPGSCGATACCGRAGLDADAPEKGELVCSSDTQENPDDTKYVSFKCNKGEEAEGASKLFAGFAAMSIAAINLA